MSNGRLYCCTAHRTLHQGGIQYPISNIQGAALLLHRALQQGGIQYPIPNGRLYCTKGVGGVTHKADKHRGPMAVYHLRCIEATRLGFAVATNEDETNERSAAYTSTTNGLLHTPVPRTVCCIHQYHERSAAYTSTTALFILCHTLCTIHTCIRNEILELI
jgi:hypothetical protein